MLYVNVVGAVTAARAIVSFKLAASASYFTVAPLNAPEYVAAEPEVEMLPWAPLSWMSIVPAGTDIRIGDARLCGNNTVYPLDLFLRTNPAVDVDTSVSSIGCHDPFVSR